MVQLNLALREINCKVVYFGCGLGGKTTNLEIVHEKAAPDSRGELTSIATESDRTLFFDFMPLDLGEVSGMKVKFQLYTVPGQVYYNSTRKLVLRGADGVIFVADSQKSKLEENIESIQNLEECLQEQGRSLDEMPHVIQFNKRDLDGIMSVSEMNSHLNQHGAPTYEASAASGEGVLETFKALAAIMLDKVKAMSTESSAKPGAASAQRSSASNPVTNSQRLQGGIAATPAKPQRIVGTASTPIPDISSQPAEPARPAGFESNAMPGRPMAPAASATPPESAQEEPSAPPAMNTQPPQPAAEMQRAPAPAAQAQPSQTSTGVVETVTPSIRKPRSESVPVQRAAAEPEPQAPRRSRGSISQSSVQITGEGFMISSSARRRGSEGKLFWVLGVLTILGAAAAAGWYYFLK